MKEFAILIPARGGSKRIPNKNIVELAGRPLIEYSIEESLKVTKNVYVSTDCPNIKKVCDKYKDVKIVHRPMKLAEDDSTTNSVIEHFLENHKVGIFALVQATSPLLKSFYLKEGFNKFKKGVYDTVISANKTVEFYWRQDGTPLNFDLSNKKRTQDIEDWFVENGAFYITTKDSFYKRNNLIGDKVAFIEMPKIDSIDIDNYDDLEMAESIIFYRKEKE